MKKIKVNPYSKSSISNAIKQLKDYKQWLHNGMNKFISEMAKEGCEVAKVEYGNAIYADENDVQVEVNDRGELTKAVVARGSSVLFIEFGTGITFARNHPEDQFSELSYSRTHANAVRADGSWTYNGTEAGNAGINKISKDGRQYVKTYGNPSNNSLYNAKRDIQKRVQEIAERCWN